MKNDDPLHYANEDLKKKLDDISDLFARYVNQEAQSIREDVKRITDVVYSSGMGEK